MNNKIFIIVPAYNEEECIQKTLLTLKKYLPEAKIIVINDGSTDHTLDSLRALNNLEIIIIDLPFNMGIGTAVQTGLFYAARHNAEIAVKFDGDGQHPADEISNLIAPLLNGEADFTTGSRFLIPNDGFHSTASRRVGIYFFRFLSWCLTGTALTDCTSGFRGYNRKALLFASQYYPAFDYPEPQESILFIRNHFRVKEISCRMLNRQGGRSSIRPFKAGYYMLKVTFSMIIERFRKQKGSR